MCVQVPDGRMFSCRLCRLPTCVCNQCDRDHHYCSEDCRREARQRSGKPSRDRYAHSRKGKLRAAARQQRSRDRKREMAKFSQKIVTYAPVTQPVEASTMGCIDIGTNHGPVVGTLEESENDKNNSRIDPQHQPAIADAHPQPSLPGMPMAASGNPMATVSARSSVVGECVLRTSVVDIMSQPTESRCCVCAKLLKRAVPLETKRRRTPERRGRPRAARGPRVPRLRCSM